MDGAISAGDAPRWRRPLRCRKVAVAHSLPSESPGVHDHSAITTFLFSDIEGSTQLWEREPARMEGGARAARRPRPVGGRGTPRQRRQDDGRRHVRRLRRSSGRRRGRAASSSRRSPIRRAPTASRCGRAAASTPASSSAATTTSSARVLNRTARIMAAAHGGQVLVSQALAVLLVDRLPPGVDAPATLGAVRLRDLASPESVFQVLHPSLRREFPALRSLSSTPNNLPQQVTSFIGRERELVGASARRSRRDGSSRFSAPAGSARRGCRCRRPRT